MPLFDPYIVEKLKAIYGAYDGVPKKEEVKREKGTCPKCGHAGTWVRMALKCPEHGVFAGC
jgi:ribosomal protein S27AE